MILRWRDAGDLGGEPGGTMRRADEMAENTKIQWCHATWSPWRGCTKISPGCALCYAEALSRRNPAVLGEWGPNGARVVNKDWRKPLSWDRAAAKAGERRRVFPSLCDWLEDRPELVNVRGAFLALIARTPNLDWLLLTKRPENFVRLMREVVESDAGLGRETARRWLAGYAPENVWHGVSVEDQGRAWDRMAASYETPAAVRWISYEPALGPVNFGDYLKPNYGERHPNGPGFGEPLYHWIVVGGESNQGGKQARPFDLAWARATVEQCREAGVPVFVKQLGARPEPREWWDESETPHVRRVVRDSHGGDWDEFPADLRVREFPAARVGVS